MVKSQWSDEEAAKCNGDLLALRVYTSRLISWTCCMHVRRTLTKACGCNSGGDQDLVLHGGGNTSVKSTFKDVFGEEIPTLYVKGSGWDLAVLLPPLRTPSSLSPSPNLCRVPREPLPDTEKNRRNSSSAKSHFHPHCLLLAFHVGGGLLT
eukprot:1230147-Rhodomonas_salina.4